MESKPASPTTPRSGLRELRLPRMQSEQQYSRPGSSGSNSTPPAHEQDDLEGDRDFHGIYPNSMLLLSREIRTHFSHYVDDFVSSRRSTARPVSMPHSTHHLLPPRPATQSRTKAMFAMDSAKLPSRIRLFFRIFSMISAGTTCACVVDVTLAYTRTHFSKSLEDDKVWPEDLSLSPTIGILVTTGLTFAGDFMWFLLSAKERVRRLSERKHKLWAVGLATICATMLLVAVVYAHFMDKPTADRSTLAWVCRAKDKEWGEEVYVDFPFLCGELVSISISASLACDTGEYTGCGGHDG